MIPTEDYQMAHQMVKEASCSACGEPFPDNRLKLDVVNDDPVRFETDHECPECGTAYDIAVFESEPDSYTLHKDRQDMETPPGRPATGFSHTRKANLYKEILPIRDVVEALDELLAALRILTFNKECLDEVFEEIDQQGGFNQPPEFKNRIDTDVHNYLAASYTFDERLREGKSELSTDEYIEDELEQFREDRAVIRGLRIFEQHNLSISGSLRAEPNQDTGVYDTTIAIDLDRVKGMDYEKGVDHYYSSVDGDRIDFKQEVEDHFRAVEDVFIDVWNHTIHRNQDEIEEYDELTSVVPVDRIEESNSQT